MVPCPPVTDRRRVWALWAGLAVGPGLGLAGMPGCGGSPAPNGSPRAEAGATPSASAARGSRLPAWGEPGPTPLDGPREGELVAAELHRRADAPAVIAALEDADPNVVARGVWALARIGGDDGARRLLGAFDRHAADPWFPLGALALLDPPAALRGETREPQGVWALLEDRLWLRFAVVDAPADSEALLLAIARLGGPKSMDRLAAELAGLLADRPSAAETGFRSAMEAMAILCARGYSVTEAGADVLAEGLTVLDGEIRRPSAYALGRCAAPSAERLAGPRQEVLAERLATMAGATDPEEARLAWYALAGIGDAPAKARTHLEGEAPPPWRVEVEAVRALAASAAGRQILAERLGAMDREAALGARSFVVLQSLRLLLPHVAEEPALAEGVEALSRVLSTKGSAPASPVLACTAATVLAAHTGDLAALRRCGEGTDLPPWAAEAMAVDALIHMGDAQSESDRVARLVQLAGGEQPQLAAAALSAFADLDGDGVKAVLRRALAHDDVGVVSAAAGAIATRAADEARRDPDAVPALAAALVRLDNASAVEARIAAIEALGRLARVDPASREPMARALVPLARDPNAAVRSMARAALSVDADARERFDAEPPVARRGGFAPWLDTVDAAGGEGAATGLRVQTPRGSFQIDFEGASAPMNQANLVRLAKAGHFDGLRWHRVVPGFVLQGGDPRSDGYGGVGYLVPCEWSPLRYRRGTVGIPLAGRDTGSGQIFITQGPQPHLDGRYTVVGTVTEGLDVVDRLLPHDRIERVEVLTGRP